MLFYPYTKVNFVIGRSNIFYAHLKLKMANKKFIYSVKIINLKNTDDKKILIFNFFFQCC